MKYASVDIGTNTTRLLIAEVDAGGGGLKTQRVERAITRLGGGFSETEGVAKEAAERVFAVLKSFGDIIKDDGVETVLAFATSAARSAVNKDWFLTEAGKSLGSEVKVITGEEEARLSLRGVGSVVDDTELLVIDVGGGSTEIVATMDGETKGLWSEPLGVVALTETYLKSDPPTTEELFAMDEEIYKVVSALKLKVDESGFGGTFRPVGTAGTMTTLAAIAQELDEYDPALINGFLLTRDVVESIYRRLVVMNLSERAKVLSLEKGREDLIIAGAAITLSVIDGFGLEGLTVSDSGLLEGIILNAAAN